MRIGSLCDNFVWNEFGPPRAGPNAARARFMASEQSLSARQGAELLAPVFRWSRLTLH